MSTSKKVSLSGFSHYCSERSLPFAFYRLPGEATIRIIAQKKSLSIQKSFRLKDERSGFLLAPFHADKETQPVLIESDILCDEHTLPKLDFGKSSISPRKKKNGKIKEQSKSEYLKLVRKVKEEIKKKNYGKIVIARNIKFKRPVGFDAVQYFRLLCKHYPDAFVSLVFTPWYGLWMGASPEILLQANSKQMTTFSLAGTKDSAKRKQEWGAKEKAEQQIVSDYIRKSFSKFTKEKPVIEGPETIAAGNLLHLRTVFTYKSIPLSKWPQVVQHLHPTPAVAGIPKDEAIDFILKNEKNSRSFYSGYLGPVNVDKQVNLFVNLRCMQVLKNKLVLFVGGGITAHSSALDEWVETKIKANTLLNLL